MGIKVYNPYTPSRRNMTGLDFDVITTDKPEKSLLAPKSKTAGRNNQGKITVRHHGEAPQQPQRLTSKTAGPTRKVLHLVPNCPQLSG